MFFNTATSSERLSAWRTFRQQFPKNGTEQMLVEGFKRIKLENRYIDYYTPESWPGVFEIVSEGYFCQSGVSLVLAANMHYLGFIKESSVTFDVISNHITGIEGLVLKHQNMYYNFIQGEISTAEYVRENSTKFDTHIITIDKLYA